MKKIIIILLSLFALKVNAQTFILLNHDPNFLNLGIAENFRFDLFIPTGCVNHKINLEKFGIYTKFRIGKVNENRFDLFGFKEQIYTLGVSYKDYRKKYVSMLFIGVSYNRRYNFTHGKDLFNQLNKKTVSLSYGAVGTITPYTYWTFQGDILNWEFEVGLGFSFFEAMNERFIFKRYRTKFKYQ